MFGVVLHGHLLAAEAQLDQLGQLALPELLEQQVLTGLTDQLVLEGLSTHSPSQL
jgi:hypothetical protein